MELIKTLTTEQLGEIAYRCVQELLNREELTIGKTQDEAIRELQSLAIHTQPFIDGEPSD